MASMQDTLTELLAPVAESFGCELWALEYLTQGKQAILRLYIDKESGITLEDCERVSRQASSVLDVEDPIRSEYTLEVSSPGADRSLHKLSHFERFVGEVISVRLRMAFDGRRKFVGRLRAVEGEDVVVAIDNDEFLLPIDLIDKANIVPQF